MQDFWSLICLERGAPEGWRWYSLEVVGDPRSVQNSATLVKGAVCTVRFARGKRKGDLNWAKRDKSTDLQFVITPADYEARKRKYEVDTGTCAECDAGKVLARWNAASGNEYRDCRKCNGTGKALLNARAETK